MKRFLFNVQKVQKIKNFIFSFFAVDASGSFKRVTYIWGGYRNALIKVVQNPQLLRVSNSGTFVQGCDASQLPTKESEYD